MTLIAGAAALFILWYVLKTFQNTNPAILARGMKLAGGVISLGAAALIGARGNFAFAIPLGLFGLGLLGWAPFGPAGFSSRTQRGSGQQSKVRSAFLDMTLDHDSGALTGDVIAGPYAGRSLAEFDLAGLRELIRGFDDESRALLAGYLDRRFPDWRAGAGADAGTGAGTHASRGKMTREEAYQILGLAPGASNDAIAQAHRNLMKKLHPDQGGSTYLAARVNEARDLLIRRG
jgi:hypothetical protein